MPDYRTHEADAAQLQALIAQGLTLRLFSNRVEPSPDLTASAFVEASFPGYAPISLPASVWSVEVGKGDMPSAAYAPYQTFQRTRSGEPAYLHGYWLQTPAGDLAGWGLFMDGTEVWDVTRGNEAVQVRPGLVAKVGD